MIFSGLQRMHAGLGDGRLVNFTLEHGYRWIRQYPLHTDFWAPPIYFPFRNATAFTDTMIGFAPIYWVPRFLGAPPDTAIQWWVFAVYVLNFASAYALLRRGLKVGILESTAGALLLAVISFSTTGHYQLNPYFYVMLGLLALYRIFDNGADAPSTPQRRSWVVVLCLCAVLQVWGAVYPFFFFSFLSALALAVALVIPATRRKLVETVRADIWVWVLCALVSALLVAPLLIRYGITADTLGYRNYSKGNMPRLYNWVITGPGDPVFDWLQSRGRLPQKPRTTGIGIVTLCVALTGLALYWRRVSVRLIVFATVIMVLVSTMVGDFSLWRLIHEYVPGAGGIRAHWRVTMCLIPAAVVGVAFACKWANSGNRWWLAVVLVSFCVAERFKVTRTVEKEYVRAHVAAIAERVDPKYDAFMLVGTRPDSSWVSDDAAWVALETGIPTINGRYGHRPKEWKIYRHNPLKKDDQKSRQSLEKDLQAWLGVWGLERDNIQWIEYETMTRKTARQGLSRP